VKLANVYRNTSLISTLIYTTRWMPAIDTDVIKQILKYSILLLSEPVWFHNVSTTKNYNDNVHSKSHLMLEPIINTIIVLPRFNQ